MVLKTSVPRSKRQYVEGHNSAVLRLVRTFPQAKQAIFPGFIPPLLPILARPPRRGDVSGLRSDPGDERILSRTSVDALDPRRNERSSTRGRIHSAVNDFVLSCHALLAHPDARNG